MNLECDIVVVGGGSGGRADVWPGGKRLGGGSSINGMMYVRGHRADCDGWAAQGAPGWKYDDVVPYFRRMESFADGDPRWRGNAGPISVSHGRVHYPIVDEWVRAAESCGIPRTGDHNGENPGEGTDLAQVTQRNGLRSSSTSYLKLPGAKGHLRTLTECQVTRLVIENGRAGVVVAAGGMNTPRLLMLSGIGPGAH